MHNVCIVIIHNTICKYDKRARKTDKNEIYYSLALPSRLVEKALTYT